ncbi:MAG: CARDB domain-containing protein [Ferruginibacter sp.]
MKKIKNILFVFLCFVVFSNAKAQVNITRAEYFIDNDPGFGNATSISITPATDIADRQVVIPLAGLTDGFHNFFLRTKDANNNWSVTNKLSFYKTNIAGSLLPNIIKAEYFIDTDPGFGAAVNIPVTASTDVADRSVAVPLNSVGDGFHNLYLRSLDANGKWSITNKLPFFKINTNNAVLPNIVKAEYFIDTDPGFGAAANIPVTASPDIADRSYTIPLNTVGDGFHNLYVRSRDANGKWSVTNKLPFFKINTAIAGKPAIARAEYFIDIDPGFGAASNIPVDAAADITDRSVVINLNDLADGFHNLYLRSLDETGKWSVTNKLPFFKINTGNAVLPNIVKAEYFIDTDPGFGLAKSIPLSASSNISNLTFSADLTGIAAGFHRFYLRSLDANGKWSITNTDTFSISATVIPTVTIGNLQTLVCAGNNYAVPYTVNIKFSTGNVFTAELSDANGSFTSPVTIGSLASDTSGTINCIIPAGTVTGTSYRVRITSSSPISNSKEGGDQVTIRRKPELSFIVNGPNPTCTGIRQYNLSATETATTYTWQLVGGGGVITPASSSASVNWTKAGSDTLVVTANNACGLGAPVQLVVQVTGNVPAFTPSLSVNNRTLTAAAASSEQGVTAYQWFRDGVVIAGQTAQTFTVPDNETGSYTAAYINACGNGGQSAAVIIAVVRNNQSITFTPVASKTYGDAAFDVSATASSGLPVVYSIVSGPATIVGNTVTITGAGTVVVQAYQAGTNGFNEATSSLSIVINKAAATVALSNLVFTYDGTGKKATVTTTPLGLNVAVTYNGSSALPVNAGSYSVSAVITSPNYQGTKDSVLVINKASQTITLQNIPGKSYNDAAFAVTASTSSGLLVSLNISTVPVTGVASLNGNIITILGGGTVTVTAMQAGNENYTAATNAVASFTVAPPAAKDIEMVNLVSPSGGCGMGAQADITVRIKNTGTQAVTSLPVSYIINNSPAVTETISSSIAAGAEMDYTFNTKGNFAVAGQLYQVKIYAALPGDERNGNDTLLRPVARFAPPVPNGAPADTAICIGSTATLKAFGGSTYAWTGGPSAANYTVTPTVTTTYEVVITDNNGCSNRKDSVKVTVNPLPSVNAGPDQTMLKGSSVKLSGTGSGTLKWSNGSSDAEPVVSPVVTSVYTLTVTSQLGCKATDEVQVTVNVSALTVTPGLYNYGNVVSDSTAFTSIVVTNTGTLPESVSSITGMEAPFTTTFTLPVTVPPGTSVNIPVQFTPAATLIYQNRFVLATSVGNFNITLQGKGVDPAPAWTAVPAYYDFGKVDRGTMATKEILIKNTGNIPIKISTISSSNPRFSANTAGVLNIPVGGSVPMQVKFNPLAITSYTGTITLRSSTTSLPVLRMIVNGTGFVSGALPVLDFVNAAPYNGEAAVIPEVGPPGLYSYSVVYSHPDSVAPMNGYPKLGIDKNGDGDFSDQGEIIAPMIKSSNTYHWFSGEVYTFSTDLPVNDIYGYQFIATDSLGNDAAPTEYKEGPLVTRDILDLHIYADDIVFSKPNPAVNEVFTVTATVHNNSFYPAAEVEVKFYYKDSIYLFSDTIPFVDAQSTASITRELSFAPDGFYPIKVWIDSSSTLHEGNILNNYASRPVIVGVFTVPGTIDITAAAAPSVCNKGKTNFSGHASYRGLNLAGTPPVEGGTITLTIIADATYTFKLNTDVNGNWFYRFDPCKLEGDPEGCEGPACGITYTYTVEATDYTLTSPLLQSTYVNPCVQCLSEGVLQHESAVSPCVVENKPYSYNVSIANFSYDNNSRKICAPVIYKDTIEIYRDGELKFTYALDSIASCGSATFTDMFEGLSVGDHAMAFSHTYYTKTGDRKEVFQTATFEVLPEITDLTLDGILKTGLKSFAFSDKNKTCGVTAGPHWVYLYDSLPGYTEKVLIDSFFVTEVLPQAAVGLGYNNPDWEVGKHFITIITDVHGGITELDETNNILRAEFYVIEPDIIAKEITISNSNVNAGSLINFSAKIKNEGSPVNDPFVVQFKVDGVPLGAKLNIPALNSNEEIMIVSAPYTVPVDPCPKQITVFADADAEITEYNEKNNYDTSALGVNINAGRGCANDEIDVVGAGFYNEEDFLGTSECIPYYALKGVPLFLATTVRNNGTRDTKNIKVEFRLLGQVVGTDIIPALKAGQAAGSGFFYTFATEGRYIVSAYADYSKEICETNEKDNIGNIHVDARPTMGDLQILSQHIAPGNLNPDPGQNTTVVASVTNIGDAPVGPTKVRFWVDDVQLGDDIQIDTLFAGQDTTVMATALYSSGIVGLKVIKVKADATNVRPERRESNNEATRSIIVGAAPDFANSIQEAITITPPVFYIGDTVTISNYIRNFGGDEGSAWVRFYYRSATTGEKILIDSVPFSMNDNDSFRVSKKWLVSEAAGMIITEIDHSAPPEFDTFNNIDSLPFGTAVPVRLISFNASVQNKMAFVKWQSAEEINLSHYVIERSLDGIHFIPVTSMPAAHANSGGIYSFTDSAFISIAPGNIYYRLKMVDISGEYRYSQVAKLYKENLFDLIEVYPNPVTSSLRIRIDAVNKGAYTIQILDAAGRQVFTKQAAVQAGPQEIPVNVSRFARGLYIAVLKNEKGNTVQVKFVKE